jgi:hypothetical protein
VTPYRSPEPCVRLVAEGDQRGQGASGRHGARHSASRIGSGVADRLVVTLRHVRSEERVTRELDELPRRSDGDGQPGGDENEREVGAVPAGPRPGDDAAAKRSAGEQRSGSGRKDEMRDGAVEGGAPDAAKRDDVARDGQQRDEEDLCHCGCATRSRDDRRGRRQHDEDGAIAPAGREHDGDSGDE